MSIEYRPRRIILTRDVTSHRGTIPAGAILTIFSASAICTSGECKSWDVHGLSPDAFEFIHDDETEPSYAELSGEIPMDEFKMPGIE